MENTDTKFKQLTTLVSDNLASEALELITNEFDTLFNNNPVMLLELHLDLLIDTRRFVEASQALKRYIDQPYVSFEFEQMVKTYARNIDKQIDLLIKSKSSNKELLIQKLKSKDEVDIYTALQQIGSDGDFRPYIDCINDILQDEKVFPSLKSFILGSLKRFDVKEKVVMKRFGKIQEIIPSELPELGQSIDLIALVDRVINIKNISVIMLLKELLRIYQITIYPDSIMDSEHHQYVCLVGAYIVACSAFKEPAKIKDKLMQEYDITEAELQVMCESIKTRALNQNI